MSDTEFWRLSATETVSRTLAGDVAVETVVQSAIDRMNAVNPTLNAVVEDLSQEALERARTLDRRRAEGGRIGPLFGVPVTIKVNVDQKGHATSNGVEALKDVIAPDNAPVVDNLLRAGAVVIGRTNTPEFSFRADTDNPLYGRTHNPWGDHISCGGSSGGAAVSVMSGMCPLGHGNDIGGSLRFPAAATGAVSIKPGLGRVPAWNPSQSAERGMLAQSMSVQGLIARSAADLSLSMPHLAAADPRDPFHIPMPWGGEPSATPIRVGFTKETWDFDLHPEVSRALDVARDALVDAGYDVVEVEPPQLREAALTGYRALMGEMQAMMGDDLRKYGSATLNAIFDEYYAQFPPYQGAELLRMMARRSHYARVWSLFLEDYPLVLTPFLPQPFFRPDRDAEGAEGVREALGSALWSYSINFMGLPAACVPARLAELTDGPTPVNVQIIARRWREDQAIDAAAAIEQRVGRLCDLLWERMG